MASATPAAPRQGTSISALEDMGVRGRHGQGGWPHGADAGIEAKKWAAKPFAGSQRAMGEEGVQ
jgi:hypothetical protein